jgi:hypothetical protein
MVKPREALAQKQSQAKDSNAKKIEIQADFIHIVGMKGYKEMKKIAAGVCNMYRSSPGRTKEEDESYLTYCKLVWAYNMLWTTVEATAKVTPVERKQNANDGW